MKKLLFTLIFTVSAVMVFSQSNETRQLDNFDEISVSEAIKVKLIPGSSPQAVVRVEGTDPEYVITEVRGGQLKIYMSDKKRNYRNVDVAIEGDELDIEVSSAADVRVTVDVRVLNAKVSSAGEIEVRGSAREQYIKCSSAGDYNGYDLQSEKADVDVSSSGDARILVSDELKAEASSGGSIKYNGDPKVVIADSSSGGRVRKG
jgi:hypothetical protein